MADSDTYPKPPGQERPIPSPTKTGTVPFTIPTTGDKGETAYFLWGNLTSDKIPLICLHGGPGVPHNYLLPLAHLHTDLGIPVLLYDQIGCGASTHFRDKKGDTAFWTPELFMAELDNLKAALGIDTFDLLGQSWGGMLAATYAITQPAGLRKLIIADSPASMATWTKVADRLRSGLPRDVQDTLTRCEREGTTESEEYQAAVMVFYARHLCRVVPFPKELADSFSALEEDNTVYLTMNGPSEFHVVGSLRTWTVEKELESVTAETVPGGILLVNGVWDEAADECVRPFFTRPSARVKWVQFAMSSHVPQLEETERFIKTLGEFLMEK